MLTLVDVTKSIGDRVLFSAVNLTIGPQERIGIVGPNGSGKTTLMRLMAGQTPPEKGACQLQKRTRIGFLQQEVPKYTGKSVLEEMLAGHDRHDDLQRQIAEIEERLRNETDPAVQEQLAHRQGDLAHEFQNIGGYDMPARAQRILAGLGFKDGDHTRPTTEFSGGWLMRLALGRLLLLEPDLLLLDEPTNYLDLESVVWLESYLRNHRGSLLIASHDRVLLNNLSLRILEVALGSVTSYTGNYDEFIRAKEIRLEGLMATQKSQERERKQAQVFIDRFRYKNTKARQVQSRIKRLERMEKIELPQDQATLRFRLPPPPPVGRIVLELRNVAKAYGKQVVYEQLDLTIERGDRLVLVGPNGAGKSTLLKMIAGVLETDRGERVLDRRAKVAYFAQHQVEALTFSNTIFQELEQAAPRLLPEDIRRLMGRFLFSGDDVFKPIEVLSGGEKVRVALAKILADPPNLVLLDEPTSHLDIPSRDTLEEAFNEYEGAIVMITHDRHFIERLATRVIDVGGGTIRTHLGGYREFLEKKAAEEAASRDNGPEPVRETVAATPTPAQAPAPAKTKEQKRKEAEARNQRYRRVKPLQKEIAKIESELERMESDAAAMDAKLADPSFYEDRNGFEETFRKYNDLKAVIASKTQRWEELTVELEALDEEIGSAD